MSDLVAYSAPWVELLTPAAELARLVGKTEFVPANLRDRGGAIAACVLYGAELGLGPMQSLAKIAVIDGRPAPAAELARALCLGAGHDLWVEDATNTKAIVAGKRRNSEHVQRVTWTMDDARRAQLDGKPNWRRYPRAMLVARASAELVRNMAPEVLGGITLMAEEIEDGEALPSEPPSIEAAKAVKATKATRKRSLAAVPASDDAPHGRESDAEASPAVPTAEDSPARTQPEASGDVSPAQRKMAFALFHDLEVDDHGSRLALTSEIVGRPIDSSNDLTPAEFSILLDDLQRRKAEGWIAF